MGLMKLLKIVLIIEKWSGCMYELLTNLMLINVSIIMNYLLKSGLHNYELYKY